MENLSSFLNSLNKTLKTCVLIVFVLYFCGNLFSQHNLCDLTLPVPEDETTLCEYYSNFTPNITLGTGINKASQIIGNLTGNILIAGDFQVDRVFKFYDAVIKVAPGKKIFIASTLTAVDEGYINTSNGRPALTVDNCDIFACSGLWLGIQLTTKTDLIIKNGSHIEDAEKAVYATNTNATTLHITSTIFNRNNYGIYLSNSTFNNFDPVFRSFYGNQFTCSSYLNGNDPDLYSEAGVYLENITANWISDITEQSENFFEKQNHGIKVIGSTAHLRATRLSFNLCWIAGISLEESSNLDLWYSTFEGNINSGIYGKDLHNLNVYQCNFQLDNFEEYEIESHPTGILLASFSNGGVVNIRKSHFFTGVGYVENCKGIYIKGDQALGNTSVNIWDENSFNFGAIFSQMIEIDGNFLRSFTCNIDHNSFNMITNALIPGNRLTSINVINGDKHNINIIGNKFRGNGNRCFGILLNGGLGSVQSQIEISENEFEGETDSNIQEGVGSRRFSNTKICGNTDFWVCATTFYFKDMSFTDLSHNTIYGGNVALGVATQSEIGTQFHKGNIFYDIVYYLGPFLVRQKSKVSCASDPLLSRFYVDTPQSIYVDDVGYSYFSEYFPFLVELDYPGGGTWWHENYDGSPSETCLSQEPPSLADTVDMIISLDDIDDYLPDSANQWDAYRYLYDKLKGDTSYLNLRTEFDDFITANTDSLVGIFYLIDEILHMSCTRTSSNLMDLEVLEIEIGKLYHNIDSISNITTWSNQNASDLTDLFDSLYILRDTLINLHLDHLNHKNDLLDSAQAILNTISSRNLDHLENARMLKVYLIDILKNGYDSLSLIELDDIVNRASQCPDDGGLAIFGLRGLINICELAKMEETFSNCDTTAYSFEPADPDTIYEPSPLITMFDPNHPDVSNEFTIPQDQENHDFPKDHCIKAVSIFTLDGNILFASNNLYQDEFSSEVFFEGHQLSSGLYLLNIRYCDGSIEVKKIIHID